MLLRAISFFGSTTYVNISVSEQERHLAIKFGYIPAAFFHGKKLTIEGPQANRARVILVRACFGMGTFRVRDGK
jgi:hypothetical protein